MTREDLEAIREAWEQSSNAVDAAEMYGTTEKAIAARIRCDTMREVRIGRLLAIAEAALQLVAKGTPTNGNGDCDLNACSICDCDPHASDCSWFALEKAVGAS